MAGLGLGDGGQQQQHLQQHQPQDTHHHNQQWHQQQAEAQAQAQQRQRRHHSSLPKILEPNDVLAAVGNGDSKSRMEDYEVTRPIGKGKFGIVYRAKRKEDGKIVALKKIPVSNVDERSRIKCMREVRLLQSLDHYNIIRYEDSFVSESDLVVVLEWAAAGDLKRQVRKALERAIHFEERIIWGYFSQICGAIGYMHRRRIMHRDIKPANIFLTLKGQVKVGDLGLGRLMTAAGGKAETVYSKVGTPLYMSVEVLGGSGYSWKSDVWSLGCVLYELAMLRSPFKCEGLNLYSLFQKISSGNYPPLLDYYSEELRALATGMINVCPNDRPSVDEAHSIALSMKRRMDAMGNPATPPPETAPHLRPNTSSPRKVAARAAAIKAESPPPPREAAGGTNEDEHQAADPGSKGPACVVVASGAPGIAVGAVVIPPAIDSEGAEVAAAAAAVRTANAGAGGGAVAHERGVERNDGDDDCCQHRGRHHRLHQKNHHRCCPHGNNLGSCYYCSCARPGKYEVVGQNIRRHQHEHMNLQQPKKPQPQQQQRDCYGAPRVAGNAPSHHTHGGRRDGDKGARGAGGSIPTAEGAIAADDGEKEPESIKTTTAASALEEPTSTTATTIRVDEKNHKSRNQYNLEHHSAILAASPFEVGQIGAPPALPAGMVVTASGIVLPRLRAGKLAAKVKAAKQAAKAAAAAAASGESEGTRRDGSRCLAPRPRQQQAPPGLAVAGSDDSASAKSKSADTGLDTSQPVDVGAKEESVRPAAPVGEQPARSKLQEKKPLSSIAHQDDTGSCGPPASVAECVASSSTLLAVVAGRRASTANTSNTATCGTTATSSPSSSSPNSRGRQGRQRRARNCSSGVSGSRSEGDRDDDVEMMMTAENNNNNGRDRNKCGTRQRMRERQERRKWKNEHSNKHTRTTAAAHEAETEEDHSPSRPSSSSSLLPSLGLASRGSAGRGDGKSKEDIVPEPENAEVAAVLAAAAVAAAGADAASAAGIVETGSQSVAVSAARGVTSVSGDNLVAMEALLDRLSILGYEKELRRRNKPPLSRLHFSVPGGDDGGGCGDNDWRVGGRTLFPSRQQQFLGFVELSEWLLEQLGGSDGSGYTSKSAGTPTAVCLNILQACQELGFEPSRAGVEDEAGTPPTETIPSSASAVSPTSLAFGSGTPVLELLDCLSRAVLNKVEGNNRSAKTILSRVIPDDRENEVEGDEGFQREAKQLTDGSSEGGAQEAKEEEEEEEEVDEAEEAEEAEGDGGFVPVHRGEPACRRGGPAVVCGARGVKGTKARSSGERNAPASSDTAAGARAHGCAAESWKGSRVGSKIGSSRRAVDKRCTHLPESAVVMATAVSCSPGYSSSRFPRSSSDRGNGNGGGGSGVAEDELEASCLWGSGASDDGIDDTIFRGSMIEPTADPTAWRSEHKRVARRLTAAALAGPQGRGIDSWETRLGVLSTAASAISRETVDDASPPAAAATAAAGTTAPTAGATAPGGNGNGDGDGGGVDCSSRGNSKNKALATISATSTDVLNNRAPQGHEACFESMLMRHRDELSRQLKAVAAGEQIVSSLQGGGGGGGGNLARFREEARLLRVEERAVHEELKERQARVAALTDELRDAQDALDETGTKLKEAAADYSDLTKLYKAKSAIRQLKADIKAMDVLIGAKSATILGKQLGVQQAAREKEYHIPIGSRWGGLNARASGGGGSGVAAVTVLDPSRSISPASVAGTSSATAIISTTNSSGGVAGGASVGNGGRQRVRRSSVLIQEARSVLAKGPVGPTAAVTAPGAGGAMAAGRKWREQRVEAAYRSTGGDDWFGEEEGEGGMERHGQEQQQQRRQHGEQGGVGNSRGAGAGDSVARRVRKPGETRETTGDSLPWNNGAGSGGWPAAAW